MCRQLCGSSGLCKNIPHWSLQSSSASPGVFEDLVDCPTHWVALNLSVFGFSFVFHYKATGWSKKTVTSNFSLTDLKITKNGVTQSFLESLYPTIYASSTCFMFKWPKMAQSGPNSQSGPKWPKVAQSGPKWPKQPNRLKRHKWSGISFPKMTGLHHFL